MTSSWTDPRGGTVHGVTSPAEHPSSKLAYTVVPPGVVALKTAVRTEV